MSANISKVLFGPPQIFENLYSARAMWMSPTYNEVCEMILRSRDTTARIEVTYHPERGVFRPEMLQM